MQTKGVKLHYRDHVMTKNEFIEIMDRQLKLVRAEFNLSQVEMAKLLGLSKKTLVEIEKGRVSLGWKGSIVLAAIFSHSPRLNDVFGGECSDIIIALAFADHEAEHPKTMGGHVWWKTISTEDGFVIQQNILSKHYRLLDDHNCRRFASFNLNKVEEFLNQLS